jgi:hypothetical protein
MLYDVGLQRMLAVRTWSSQIVAYLFSAAKLASAGTDREHIETNTAMHHGTRSIALAAPGANKVTNEGKKQKQKHIIGMLHAIKLNLNTCDCIVFVCHHSIVRIFIHQ